MYALLILHKTCIHYGNNKQHYFHLDHWRSKRLYISLFFILAMLPGISRFWALLKLNQSRVHHAKTPACINFITYFASIVINKHSKQFSATFSHANRVNNRIQISMFDFLLIWNSTKVSFAGKTHLQCKRLHKLFIRIGGKKLVGMG